MKGLGKILFGRSPFIVWALTPFLLLFVIGMPFATTHWNWTQVKVVVAVWIELLCILVLVGLWTPARISSLAFRAVTFLVFAIYAAYVISTFTNDKSARTFDQAIEPLMGFFIIGLPSLYYTLFGRFTLRKQDPSETEEDSEWP